MDWTPRARGLARAAGLAGLAVALGAWVLAKGPSAAAQAPPIGSTLVATQEMSELPNGARWVIRNEHQTNVEHTHAGGFTYVMSGSSSLRIEGDEMPLSEGQGVWVPGGVPHTHAADGSARLWTFSLEQQLDPSAGSPSFVSKELVGYQPGPHLARLLADEYQIGAATAPHRHFGPEVVFVREGQYELNYAGTPQSYGPVQGYMVEPLTPHRLRNSAQQLARLFGLSLVPLGRATSEALPADALR